MNKTEIMTKVNRTFGRAGLVLKKYSPEILVGAGIVGTVATTVVACKATTKLSGILESTKEAADAIKEAPQRTDLAEPYTEEDAKKDLAIVYTQTGLQVAKLYAPAAVLGTLSITSILAGFNIMRQRNVALAAAYALVDNSFKEYRGRVVERFGKELDRELKYNIKTKEIEEIVVNEDGSESIVKTQIEVAEIGQYSEYAKFFDESCRGWDDNAELNLLFLRKQEEQANRVLKQKGYLFLNDVYEMLGIDRTRAGQVVGWIYDEKNPVGDNYIDFGIYDIHKERARAFVNGYEKNILLDFNVDGAILDLI